MANGIRINLSSVAAQLGGIVGPHYAASKAGALGLTHAYAALLAKEGITVNAIAPALIETKMTAVNPKARASIAQAAPRYAPLRRRITSERRPIRHCLAGGTDGVSADT